jgi:hypothetical protein
VPPNIVDSGTTDGVVAREGSNVSLSCRATGHPEPNITWKREDGSEFIYNGVAGQFDPIFYSLNKSKFWGWAGWSTVAAITHSS